MASSLLIDTYVVVGTYKHFVVSWVTHNVPFRISFAILRSDSGGSCQWIVLPFPCYVSPPVPYVFPFASEKC
jgi:hypothetical protein